MTDRMKVALIGVGMVGGTYVKALADLSDRIAFAGLCARRPESAEAFRVKHGLDAHVFGSIDEIAADPDIDFAILVTPPDARIEPGVGDVYEEVERDHQCRVHHDHAHHEGVVTIERALHEIAAKSGQAE